MKPKLYDKFGNSINYQLPNPSDRLIDKSKILSSEVREKIINLSAKYVNENSFYNLGRASMCLQFAILIKHMLVKENIKANIVVGQAKYKSATESFQWKHYWIETNSGEIIDCNIDSIIFHPDSPETIHPYNYWGPLTAIPSDRIFSEKKYLTNDDIKAIESDDDETIIWKTKIDKEY